MEESGILFRRIGGRAHVALNRPDVLNAISHDMLLRLEERLAAWEEERGVALVTIEGLGGRAFAAGGDIKALYDAGPGSVNYRFYADEYRVNTRIKRYSKPFIAFMNGIVMGGGVGLSIHGSIRVASERILFAMPETGIGLFPDVGGSYFLSRMPGAIGMYLGLTGARLKLADCLYCGIADLHVPADRWEAALAALDGVRPEEMREARMADLAGRLDKFVAQADAPPPLAEVRDQVDRHFGASTLEDVLRSLECDGGAWAHKQLEALATKSPTSLRIAFRQIREGRGLDFEDCMRMEYRLARACMDRPDFYEGVRCVILDKEGSPSWTPASLAEVEDDEIDRIFAPLGAEELPL